MLKYEFTSGLSIPALVWMLVSNSYVSDKCIYVELPISSRNTKIYKKSPQN